MNMCNNQVTANTEGVNGEESNAPIKISTCFYPLIGFELSTLNIEETKKKIEHITLREQ